MWLLTRTWTQTWTRIGGRTWKRPDSFGMLVCAILLVACLAMPFMTYQPNRITSGEGRYLVAILAWPYLLLFCGALAGLMALSLFRIHAGLRFFAALLGLLGIMVLAGETGGLIIPEGNPFARAALGSGFWLAVLAIGLMMADALVSLQAGPVMRIGILAALSILVLLMLKSGIWDGLSLLKEYRNQTAFWAEGGRHLVLSLGSLLPAILVGVPLGILCHRSQTLRALTFPLLNILQTVPSLAMFGILMVPLGYLAANYPGLGALGIRGIGAAPALVALFFYSLLPIVANTAIGFDKLDPAVIEAARGMGLGPRQRLWQIELPLALPVILTGIRIVLIQNIGIVAVAGLIGGGGFGTYIFKGLNQTATELVILGALPTVYLAFCAAIIMDSLIGHMTRKPA